MRRCSDCPVDRRLGVAHCVQLVRAVPRSAGQGSRIQHNTEDSSDDAIALSINHLMRRLTTCHPLVLVLDERLYVAAITWFAALGLVAHSMTERA